MVPPPSPTPVEPDLAVTSLLQRISLLETLLSATPAVKPPFLPLSEEAVVAFSAVPGRPKWMVAFTSIFTDYVADMSDDGPRGALEKLWAAMIDTHTSYGTAYWRRPPGVQGLNTAVGTTTRPTTWNPACKKATLTVDDALS